VRAIDAVGPKPEKNEPTLLNLAFTDGDIVCCTKFVHPPTAAPASLYFTSGTEFTDPVGSGQFRMIQQDKRQLCYIISSEPLTSDVDDWICVPLQSIITINEQSNFTCEKITLA
jgi:glutamine amidotransferase